MYFKLDSSGGAYRRRKPLERVETDIDDANMEVSRAKEIIDGVPAEIESGSSRLRRARPVAGPFRCARFSITCALMAAPTPRYSASPPYSFA